MARSLDRIIARLDELDRRVRNRTPQLGHSAIDDGRVVVTSGGQTTIIIGQQDDGTTNMVNHVNGATPPTPNPPVLTEEIGFVILDWDGSYVDNAVTPLDYGRTEVHCSSTGPDFAIDLETTLKTTLESPRGGRAAVALPYGQEFFFRLVVRSLSGKGSEPSVAVDGMARRVETPDIAPYAVVADNIADYALAVTKFKTLQHQIY